MRVRTPVVIAGLLLMVQIGGVAAAENEVSQAARIATRVAQAYEEHGGAGVHAALDEGDPWRVALVLSARGQQDAALALASGDDALAALVKQWRERPLAARIVRELDAADAALEAGDGASAAKQFATLAKHGGFVGAWSALFLAVAAPGADALDRLDAARTRAGSVRWASGEQVALEHGAALARERSAFERSLAAYDELIAHHGARGEPRARAIARMNHASTLAMLGDHRGAVAGFSEVLDALAPDDPVRMDALYNLGFVRYLLGDYAQALTTQERALAFAHALGDEEAVAECTTRLAEIELRLGQFDRAVKRARAVVETLKKVDAPARLAEAHGALGDALAECGDLEASARAYEEAMRLSESLAEHREYNVAVTRVSLGIVRRRQERLAEARALFDVALPKLEALRVEDAFAWTLRELALLDVAAGRHVEALRGLERALAIAEARDEAEVMVQVLAAKMEAHAAMGDHAALMDTADMAGAALQRTARGLAETQGALARGQRARIHELAMRSALATESPERLFRFLEQGRSRGLAEALANRRSIREALIPPELRRQEAAAATAQAIARTRYLAARRRRDRDRLRSARQTLSAARARTREVQERIQRAGKSSVLYAPVVAPDDVRATLGTGDALVLFAALEHEVVALVVTKKGLRIARLGACEPILSACRDLKLDDPGEAPGLDALRRRLVDPLNLGSARRILISPDAALHRVPFAALLAGRDVACVASATVFSLLAGEVSRKGDGILALGDPVYKDRPRLKETQAEARAIGTTVLLRERATKAELLAAVRAKPRWRAIHFACHGVPDDDWPMESSLVLSDGRLTALEVLQLQMPADLVVLSACETGRGRYLRGEGLLGLTRAFRFASGPRTVVSLWKVDDAATKALMTRFYELLETHGASTALRRAQHHIASQEKWAHPYYWAAWQLWGSLD